MDTAAEALLIIVSSVLSVFLAVAIIALAKIIKIINRLNHLIEKAESVADSAEAAAEMFRKTAGPVAFGSMITRIIKKVANHKAK